MVTSKERREYTDAVFKEFRHPSLRWEDYVTILEENGYKYLTYNNQTKQYRFLRHSDMIEVNLTLTDMRKFYLKKHPSEE